ncbi:pyridoxal phosphate-dependent aminotransferase [Shewanella marina]|uniref:pyridoxal phosphate-dependent aminotransferase n=1 Tax=Shewanella marina TaxID=487319 RepID=UPI00047067B6|nr:histidinol-phosphate transaminase [Shewanella marina]
MQPTRRSFIKAAVATSSLALIGCQTQTTAKPAISAANSNPTIALNYNENALGLPPSVSRALAEALPQAFRYPDNAKSELIAAIADTHQLQAQQIIYGNGSSQILKIAVDTFASDDAQLVMPDPTFGVIIDYAMARNLPIKKVKIDAKLDTDIKQMQQQVTNHSGRSIVYLCNPNNPTGLVLQKQQLLSWLTQGSDKLKFIIDEAYAEYAQDPQFYSAIEQIKLNNPHVIVARTFSKLYAIAGLRVGYGIAHPQTISAMLAQASIDNANLAGCVAAKAALQDPTWVALSLRSNQQAAQIVTQTLDALGLEYLPCNANFIFHKINADTNTYQANMEQAGFLVGREFNHTNGWNRLSLGTPEQMLKFSQTLIKFRQQGLV